MPNGLNERIFYIIRPDYEDQDRKEAEEYFGKIKTAKENKNRVFCIQENVKQGENKGIMAVFMDKSEVALAEAKNYKEHK